MLNKKGQGAIEYLLIIGAAILVVAVVIIALTGVLQTGQESADENNVDTIKDPLSGLLGVRLEEGKSYLMDLSIPEKTSLDIIFPKAGNGTTLRYKTGKTTFTYIKGQESWANQNISGIIKNATIVPVGSFKINTEVVQISQPIEEGILEITDFKYYGTNNPNPNATDKLLDDTINVIIKNKFNEEVQIIGVKFNNNLLSDNWNGVVFFKNGEMINTPENWIISPNEQLLLVLQPRNNPSFELNKSIGQNVTITLAFNYSKSGTSSTTYTKTLTTTIKDIQVFDESTYYELN